MGTIVYAKCLGGCGFAAGGTSMSKTIQMGVAHADKSGHSLELFEHKTLRIIKPRVEEVKGEENVEHAAGH